MNPQKMVAASVGFVLAIGGGFAGPAAAGVDRGGYLGASLGTSRSKIDEARIISGLQAEGFTVNSFTDDDRDLGYKIFGGYQFHPYFALEAGYFDLGQSRFSATTTPAGTFSGDIKLKGLNFDAVGILPFTENFSAFGRVGVNYAEARTTFAGTGAVNVPDPRRRERAANIKAGLGLEYDLTRHLSLRAEAERYRVNDAVGNDGDVELFSGGLVFRFGEDPPAPVPLATTPAPAPAPEPAPVNAVPPPPPPPAPVPPARVAFSADSLFDFNRAEVKLAGRRELDTFVQNLKSTRYEIITVTGHTDRIGSRAYNLRLSAQRAEAVKDYLVQSGIPTDKIVARGVNGDDPVTKPGDCTGRQRPRSSPALIACLQPDRRVEVEVSGTQVRP